MSIRKAGIQIFASIFLLAYLSTDAWALVAFDQNLNFNFRFNNPGARANGMGGAFIGMADDATAAYTNPAGLTILTKPEVSIEYKSAKYENTYYHTDGAEYAFNENADGISFVSLVFPANKATFAVYRHQLIKITNEYDIVRLEKSTETDIEAVTLGLGVGLKLVDNISIGASVGFATLHYKYSSELFQDSTLTPPPETKNYVDGEDLAEHYTISLLWNPVGEFNIGLVYRSGPEFDTDFITLEDFTGDTFYDSSRNTKNTLKVPDVYGIGISYRFPFGLTVAADANYIEYSDILEGFVFPGDKTVLLADWRISDYHVDDTVETHLGLEYVFDIKETPVAVRGGYFFKPDHRIRYEGPFEPARNLAPAGEDDHIFSLGLGAVFLENVQLDLAASFGDFEREYTASVVYRFE